MKKSIFILIAVVLGTVACNEVDQVNSACKDVTRDAHFGENHNKIVLEFLSSPEYRAVQTLDRNSKNIVLKDYMASRYNQDINYMFENMENYYRDSKLQQSRGNNTFQLITFDPIDFMVTYQSNFSPDAYLFLEDLVSGARRHSGDIESSILFIDNSVLNMESNNNLTICEKNALFNLSTLYKSSLELWYSYPDLKTKILKKDEYWKVASADLLFGCAGGIMGFGVGALVGCVSGSVSSYFDL